MSTSNSTIVDHSAVNDAGDQPAITALTKFAAQRSGIERNNYYSPWDSGHTLRDGQRAFKEEQRNIRADLARFREALKVAQAAGVTDADLIAEAPHAYGGRLEWIEGRAACACSYSTPVSEHAWASHYSGKVCEKCGGVAYRFEPTQGGAWQYCAGQYFPTEYRKAAATLLEAATRRVRQARPPETQERITSIAQLRALNQANGGCWFSRGTMRFHGTTIQSGIMQSSYFITLDKRGFEESAGYGYTVRTFNEEGSITRDVGKLAEFDSKAEAVNALAEHLGPQDCAKCGAVKPREKMIADEGTGEEYGRTFYYCSLECKEGH
jgi:hypothetical protein